MLTGAEFFLISILVISKKMPKTLFKTDQAISALAGCKSEMPANYILRTPWHIKSPDLRIAKYIFR